MFGIKIVKSVDIKKLEDKVIELEKENDRLMMTYYSGRAAHLIQDEIREIINCPRGESIIDAVKELKRKADE